MQLQNLHQCFQNVTYVIQLKATLKTHLVKKTQYYHYVSSSVYCFNISYYITEAPKYLTPIHTQPSLASVLLACLS